MRYFLYFFRYALGILTQKNHYSIFEIYAERETRPKSAGETSGRTEQNWRIINKNTFDNRSLGSEILNLCNKKILELSTSNDKVVLIKKTDDLRKLTSTEKKFLNFLFPAQETTLTSGKESLLKIKRAYNYLHKATLYYLSIKT